MIRPGALTIEPWAIVENGLDLDLLPETEAIFALSNGHIGLRGNLDEGEPHCMPGTYLNGVFESVPLPYAEAGYGYPEEGQSLIDVPNGKVMRLLVDDEPFDVRYGRLHHHVRRLDLRAGLLERDLEWTSPAGQTVRIRTTRLVSFVHRAVAAVCFEVTAVGAPARIVVQSTLVANEPTPERSRDPRTAVALRAPLINEYHTHGGLEASLGHRTRVSGIRVAASMDHVVESTASFATESECEPDLARVTVSTELAPGQSLKVVKLFSYGWSQQRSMPALRDQVDAAISSARRSEWDGLVAQQRDYLDGVWDRGEIDIEGDDELQGALRFAYFQVVQAAARAEQRAIPAKGLTGRGYDGHTFWDAEAFTLPVLTYTIPQAARDALLWRHSTLPLAQARAKVLGLAGAAFPWRTIRGEECSGYWPAGTAAFHINANIADAVRRYVKATGDRAFEQGAGFELLVETARLWQSLGHHDAEGCFRIDGVTGPDEYSALVDNNTFTNLMAARNLKAASDVAQRYPRRAVELGVTIAEIDRWKRAAERIVVPFDPELNVTQQSESFTRYRRWDFDRTRPDQYPLLLHFAYYLLYSSQVVKQADLVHALYLCGDHFSEEQKRRDFDYYEPITVRDSSLSAAIQAIVAAEVGHLDLAYDYFRETALIDLYNLANNTPDGLHLAALAGSWLTAVAGFGGMRDYYDLLCFRPCLPRTLTRLRFRLSYQGRRLVVDIRPEQVRYELLEGEALDVSHYGEVVHLEPGKVEERPWVRYPENSAPSQPRGRQPGRAGVGADANNGVGDRQAQAARHAAARVADVRAQSEGGAEAAE